MSGMCHTMHSGYPWRLFHFEEKVKSVVKRVFAVPVILCTVWHMHQARTKCTAQVWDWEEGGELVCRVAVHSIGMYVYCACVSHHACGAVHEYCATLPLVFTPACAYPLHVAILSVCPHTTFQPPFTLTLWWIPLWPVRG